MVFLLVLATAHTREVSRMVENDVHMVHMAERAGAEADAAAMVRDDDGPHQHHDQHHGGPGCSGQPGQPLGPSLGLPDQPDTRSFYERYIEAAMAQAQLQFAKEVQANEIKLNNGLHIATGQTRAPATPE